MSEFIERLKVILDDADFEGFLREGEGEEIIAHVAELEAENNRLNAERDTQRELIGKTAESIYGEYHDMRVEIERLNAEAITWGELNISLLQTISERQQVIDDLNAERRWIPVSERLPEVDDGYCVDVVMVNMRDVDPHPSQCMYDKQGGFEHLSTTHWIDLHKWIDGLPLPPAPESEGE